MNIHFFINVYLPLPLTNPFTYSVTKEEFNKGGERNQAMLDAFKFYNGWEKNSYEIISIQSLFCDLKKPHTWIVIN